jgi:hypothetical protein
MRPVKPNDRVPAHTFWLREPMRFLRHGGIFRSDVGGWDLKSWGRGTASPTTGEDTQASLSADKATSGLRFEATVPGPATSRRDGRNTPCSSSTMSSGRLFLDRVARQHCPSPLRRQRELNTHLSALERKGDILTLQRRGHFYFALTTHKPLCHRKVIMSPLSKVEMSP